jgi:hypothetical protein
MYIAASTIAIAPTTAQPHPLSKTPVRMRNSPAKAVEPGTASAMMPVIMSTVARTGRPRAMPPNRSKLPVPVRASTRPASRKRVRDSSPWFTIWSRAPFQPAMFVANTPKMMSPS